MNKVHQITKGMMSANLPSEYWILSSKTLPELELCHSVEQRNGQSVWEHTMSVIDLLTIKNPITLLAGVFHDLGKATTQPMEDVSLPRFPGHAEESTRIVESVLPGWGATSYITDRVARIVSTHMFDISNAMKEKTIRKFVADVAIDNLDNWFALRVADSRSYAAQRQYRNIFIEPFRRRVCAYIDSQPIFGSPEIYDLNEKQHNIMKIKGVEN